jgi:small subunit ribosomal protein S2
MMTNFKTVSLSINKLKEYEGVLAGNTSGLTKKEILNLTREKDKLNLAIGGIRDMGGRPDAVFIIDVNKEHIAVKEANNLGIPVFAILDTNSNPDGVDFPIPGNDDALRAIDLYCTLISDAVLAGLQNEVRKSGKDLGEALEVKEDLPTEADLEALSAEKIAATA